LTLSVEESTDLRGFRARQIQQVCDRTRKVRANPKDAQSVPMMKREGRMAARELVPELPDPEAPAMFGDVMEEHNTAGANLRQPGAVVVAGGLIRVKAVNVEEIYRSIGNSCRGLIKCALVQAREGAVERIVVVPQFTQDRETICSGVSISTP
jgi:hypothetical protein